MSEAPILSSLPKLQEKICFFAVADKNNFQYALPYWKSMVKFHDPTKITMLFYTDMRDETELKKLPKGIIVQDLTPYLEDKMFFYRQKPILGEELLKEYDLVVGFDVDQLVLSTLDDVLQVKTYDVGVVRNYNRFDEKFYPMVHQMPYVTPFEYYNCGMVAMRGKKFVHDWKVWCFSEMFNRCQFKEQDGLNLLTHHGNYNVYCFESLNKKEGELHWYGILLKGELSRAEIREGKVIIPQGEGNAPFPAKDVMAHLIHFGGGAGAPKNNWGSLCSPALMQYIQEEILQ